MFGDVLEIFANLAAVLTGGVAVVAYGRFVFAQRQRRRALEDHLREEKLMGVDEGRRTMMHLMAYLSMTETEVLQAGFSSKHVTAVRGIDEQGRASRLYFEYCGSDIVPARKL
jgi:hypothetical protein